VLSLALGVSLILAWQPRTPAAQRARWQRLHARPDALPLGSPVATPSRAAVVRAFVLGSSMIACLDCPQSHTVEALPAADGPEAQPLVPHVSSGTSLGGSRLQPVAARVGRVAAATSSRRDLAGTSRSARCARPGRAR
jgi:hypothetical protein